jgi:hypothetical protein
VASHWSRRHTHLVTSAEAQRFVPRCRQVAVGPFRAGTSRVLPCIAMLTCFLSGSGPLCGKRASRLRYLFTVRDCSNPFSALDYVADCTGFCVALDARDPRSTAACEMRQPWWGKNRGGVSADGPRGVPYDGIDA